MATTRTASLIVEMLDRVTGPARRISASVRSVTGNIRDMPTAASAYGRLDAAIERNAAALDRARMGVVENVAAAWAFKAALSAPMRAAANFETALEDIGQKAGIPQEKLAALGAEIQTIAKTTNMGAMDIAAAVDALVGRGMAMDAALAVADPIARAAVAYNASAEDLAATAMTAVDNLKVKPEAVLGVFDALAHAGKEGAFELKDMAAYLPSLGAAYASMGQEGVGALADLGAAAQVMRKDTGDSSSAATRLQNVLQKTYSPATIKKFSDKGVDLLAEMQAAAERGLTPLEAIADITDKTLGGDLKGIGSLFEDAEAQAGIRSLIQHREEFRRIRAEALKAQGVVMKDYERRVRTAQGAQRRWNASIESLNVALGSTLLPLLNDILDRIVPIIYRIGDLARSFPGVTEAIVAATGALIGFRGIMGALRLIGLTGKGGALSLMASAMDLIIDRSGAAATAAERSVVRQNAAGARLTPLARFALKGGAIGAGVYMGLNPTSLNMGRNGETEEQSLETTRATVATLTPEERKALHDAEQARAMAGASQTALVRTEARIAELKGEAESIRDYIREIQAEIDNVGTGPLTEELTAPMRQRLDAEQTRLRAIEDELAAVQAKVAETGNAISGLEEINPTVKIDMSALDSALAKIARMRSSLGVTLGEPSAPRGPNGERAKGGPMSPGRTYLVGEEGPELVTPTRSGYVHPNGSGGGRSMSLGGVTLHAPMHFHGVSAADAESLFNTFTRRLQCEIAAAMRGTFGDLGEA